MMWVGGNHAHRCHGDTPMHNFEARKLVAAVPEYPRHTHCDIGRTVACLFGLESEDPRNRDCDHYRLLIAIGREGGRGRED